MQDSSIANRLKALRQKHNLSQKEAAEKLAIHHSTLSKYESSQRQIPTEMLEKFSQTYDVTMSELLQDVKEKNQQSNISYIVKRPYQGPVNRFSIILALSLFIAAYGYVFTGYVPFLITLIILGVVQIGYQAYHFFIHVPAQRKSVSFSSNKKVYYVLSDESLVIRRTRFESILNCILGFVSMFMALGFFLVYYQEISSSLDQNFITILLSLNFFVILYVMIHFILGKVYQPSFSNEVVNTIFNTYKFVLMKVVALFTFFMMLLFLGDVLNSAHRSLDAMEFIAIFLFIHLYLFFIYGTAQVVISFLKKMIITTD